MLLQQLEARLSVRDAVRRDDRRTREAFTRARKVEEQYARALRQIARHCGQIINGFPAGDPEVLPVLNATLARYSEILLPWAKHTAKRIITEINRWDEVAWTKHTREMSEGIREALRHAPVGKTFRELQEEQVVLIQSLPVEAGQRVHKLTMEGLANSTRAAEIAAEIRKTGLVTASRADLIARTEVARAATSFTQARAINVGSTHYIWRTVGDPRVRASHKAMQGQTIAWDTPPEVEPGHFYHAGQFPNCRCFPLPLVPD